jgi:hypothetical protein
LGVRSAIQGRKTGAQYAKPATRRKQMRLLAAIGASLAMWAFILMGVAGLILKFMS